jgi:hypothetical protein
MLWPECLVEGFYFILFYFFEIVKYFIGGFLRNASDRTSDTLQQVT